MKNTGTLKVTTPSPREVQMVRVFNAPRALVFKAMTTPELMKRWYGPRGHQMTECEVDFRVGGKWRHITRSPEGGQMGMSGTYREVTPPDGFVSTESFDDFPGESVVTIRLVEEAGKTTMTTTVLYPSQEIRDAVVASGMEHGAAETYDRLAEELEKVA